MDPAHAHVCFGYDDPADFVAGARAFLAEGLRAGERVCLVGPAVDDLDLDGVEHASVEDLYPPGTVIDPPAQVAAYAARTAEALAAGYTGFRVAADATPLVRGPEQLRAFARYEHLVDRYMTTHPYSALCAYDRGALGGDTVARLACLHPGGTDPTPFRLYACPPAHGSAALTGELDFAGHDLFPEALESAHVQPLDGALVFDAGGLTFVDHHAVLALADHARRRRLPAVLREAPPAAARLVGLLGIDAVRVRVAA